MFLTEEFQLINVKGIRNRKSPLKCHSINCHRKYLAMDTKINGRKLRRKHYIYASFQSVSPQLCINYKGKNSDLTVKKLGIYYLNQVININITSAIMNYTLKNG